MTKRSTVDIPVGARFAETSKFALVWVVQRGTNDAAGNPHVVVAREDDPTWTVTIAASELHNRSRFRRLDG